MEVLIFLFLFSDSVANRGEKLELLVDKTENLNANVSFYMLIALLSINYILLYFEIPSVEICLIIQYLSN